VRPAILPGEVLMALVLLDPRCRVTWPWLPGCAPRGSILVGPTGEQLVVREDGGLDPVVEGGRPHAGIAADPTAGRNQGR
jgi:hypothetical protein